MNATTTTPRSRTVTARCIHDGCSAHLTISQSEDAAGVMQPTLDDFARGHGWTDRTTLTGERVTFKTPDGATVVAQGAARIVELGGFACSGECAHAVASPRAVERERWSVDPHSARGAKAMRDNPHANPPDKAPVAEVTIRCVGNCGTTLAPVPTGRPREAWLDVHGFTADGYCSKRCKLLYGPRVVPAVTPTVDPDAAFVVSLAREREVLAARAAARVAPAVAPVAVTAEAKPTPTKKGR